MEPLSFSDPFNGASSPGVTLFGPPHLAPGAIGGADWLPPVPPEEMVSEVTVMPEHSADWLLQQWLDLGLQQLEASNYPGAIEAFERALDIQSDLTVARHGRAIALVGAKAYAEALPELEALLQQIPHQMDLWGNYGHALAAMERHEEALAAYRHILAIDPNVVNAWLDCGRLLQTLDRWGEAAAAYERALELQPTASTAWFARGMLQKKLGQRAQALESFERTLSIDPHCKEAWNYRGNLLEDLGRTQEAREAYQRAIDLDPQYAEAWNNLGIALDSQQAHQEALEAFHQSLASDPNNPDVWNNCGLTLDSLGQLGEAVTAFDRALALTQNSHWKSWANRGCVLWRLHGYAAALKNWNQGIDSLNRQAPDYALGCGILHYHKGRAHVDEGQRHSDAFPYLQEARLCFEQALNFLAPDRHPDWYLEAAQGAIDTYRALGNADQAQALMYSATELLRRRMRETDCTSQKMALANKLASFYQNGRS